MTPLRSLPFPPMSVISTAFFSALGVAGGLLGAPRGLYDWIHRHWSRSLLWAAGVRVRAEGIENIRPGKPHVFIVNHQSFFDIWAMMATLPASLRFVAKRELASIPLFARACRAAGHVFIDRRDPAAAVEAIRAAAPRMRRDGLSLVFFPEGTRSPDGRLGRFRKGSFTLAIEAGADLVAVAVDGGGRILPRGKRLPRPGVLRLRCAPPVSLADLGSGDRDVLVERTRDRIEAMLTEMRGEGSLAS